VRSATSCIHDARWTGEEKFGKRKILELFFEKALKIKSCLLYGIADKAVGTDRRLRYFRQLVQFLVASR